jgi:hypothetical protein
MQVYKDSNCLIIGYKLDYLIIFLYSLDISVNSEFD